MTENPEKRDLRELQRTDESRAAEKEAGDSPFDRDAKRPQDAPVEDPASTIK